MACLAGWRVAQAEPVDVSKGFYDNAIVTASNPMLVSDLMATVAGTVTFSITDLRLGDLLSSLSTSITLFDGRKLQLEGSSSAVFDVGANQRFTTSIYAQASGTKGWGVYALDIGFSPKVSEVPLPLGAWLLLSGFGLLATRVRRAQVIGSPLSA
jgi:hypothetical protein